jgi:dihydrolipoamide dehydrogenase
MSEVDAIVIGSGQGGSPLALEMAKRGKKVVLFERHRPGGSCLNWGCTPSKTFLASAHAAGRARDAQQLGVRAQVEVDFKKVMERVREVRNNFITGLEKRLLVDNLKLVHAEGAFTAENQVEGGGEKFRAPLVVIDTGSSPLAPPVEGLEKTPYLTDHNFWDLEDLPLRTLVLGGGYIGLELGQGLARLGSRVRIIENDARIMKSEIPEVSEVLQKALERDGVEFHLKSTVGRIAYADGIFRADLQNGTVLESDALLVAAGRRPNTAALNAPAAGIELDQKGYVKVNEHFETTRRGVYAIGDAAGQPAFTHVSWEDYRRLLAILDGQDRTRDDRVLGYAAYTDPQLGRVGLTLEQAKREGYHAREATLDVKDMMRAIEWGHDLGFYRMVVDENTGKILGATMVGYEAGELVHVFMDLMEAGATWQVLERAQHIHPTYAENLPSLARKFRE